MKVTDTSPTETHAFQIQRGECCRHKGEIYLKIEGVGHAFANLSTGKTVGFDPSTKVTKVEAEVIVK